MRRGLSSGSTQPSTYDTHITTRPPSTVQEELLFADIDAMAGGDHFNIPASERIRSQYEQELQELQERRQKVAERYTARMEYLEARLQGQLIKEKLRK
jgi:vacuolar-type H+-ATPase subunit I/STV1